MVDLVKIRKKAKEKAGRAKAAADAPPAGAGDRPPALGPEEKIARFLDRANQRRVEVREEPIQRSQPELELLAFGVGGEQYAIDIEHVVEIVTPRAITPVPNADPSIVGILSLRGIIVTVIDARSRLRHRTAPERGPEERIIVTEQEGENIGFVVDRVLRVIKLQPDEIQPHPVVHSSEHDESVRGVFTVGDTLTMLLDLNKLLGVGPNGTDL